MATVAAGAFPSATSLQASLQYSSALPFHVGLVQPVLRHTGTSLPAASSWKLMACETAAVAFWTVSCHWRPASSSTGAPVSVSMSRLMCLVHNEVPQSESRTSISCRPSQFVPSPSPPLDHFISRPSSEPCCSRNVSPVFSKALAQSVPASNFALSTASMAHQLSPMPAKLASAPSASFACFFRATEADSSANSSAIGQNLRAWKAASEFLKATTLPGLLGASIRMPSLPRSNQFPK
mmetsp:Transcript_14846/g.46743  ORF Transcript_14846/g.46743 Transcript_14846/m.46743 type:complete len:237 (-) Transcript_14846:1381-2091(-)